jgi:hypothetical protein
MLPLFWVIHGYLQLSWNVGESAPINHKQAEAELRASERKELRILTSFDYERFCGLPVLLLQIG